MTKSTTNRKTNNTVTDSKVNMPPINEARTKLNDAWSGEAAAATNIAVALKGYAESLDDNGLGLVAIVNADRKVPYSNFKGRYGDEIFDEDDWKAARREIATLKKLWLQYYSDGKQTFEAWLQNFRRNMMLFMSVKRPSKEAAKRRSANRKLYNLVKKKYDTGKSKPTVQSDTVKIKNKAKSIKVRLDQIVALLNGIKDLDSKAGKDKADKILASIDTLRTRVAALEGK